VQGDSLLRNFYDSGEPLLDAEMFLAKPQRLAPQWAQGSEKIELQKSK